MSRAVTPLDLRGELTAARAGVPTHLVDSPCPAVPTIESLDMPSKLQVLHQPTLFASAAWPVFDTCGSFRLRIRPTYGGRFPSPFGTPEYAANVCRVPDRPWRWRRATRLTRFCGENTRVVQHGWAVRDHADPRTRACDLKVLRFAGGHSPTTRCGPPRTAPRPSLRCGPDPRSAGSSSTSSRTGSKGTARSAPPEANTKWPLAAYSAKVAPCKRVFRAPVLMSSAAICALSIAPLITTVNRTTRPPGKNEGNK